MTTSNLQPPTSREAPRSKLQTVRPRHGFGFSNLDLIWRLEVGCWSFCRSVRRRSEHASTFVIVLWIAFGLVSIALYFAHAMNSELRAADNRVSGICAEQAIDGAVRYVSSLLSSQI